MVAVHRKPETESRVYVHTCGTQVLNAVEAFAHLLVCRLGRDVIAPRPSTEIRARRPKRGAR